MVANSEGILNSSITKFRLISTIISSGFIFTGQASTQALQEVHAQSSSSEIYFSAAEATRIPSATLSARGIESNDPAWFQDPFEAINRQPLDQFLANRPRGAYRISGQARGGSQGADIQVFGRGRQTAPIDMPDETVLTAIGLASRFRPSDMDLAFSTAVVAASYGRGVIACR